jgi:hypothetical protein
MASYSAHLSRQKKQETTLLKNLAFNSILIFKTLFFSSKISG